MEIIEFFSTILSDYTFRNIFLGSLFFGFLSGMIGTFVVLKKQSLAGDVISHSALPGIALIYIIFRSKNLILLLFGGALSGWIALNFVYQIKKNSKVKQDSALGLVLSVFFGLGIVLLTFIQKKIPDSSQAGLDKFLFGQASSIVFEDVLQICIVIFICAIIVILFWKDFKLFLFDHEYFYTLGFKKGNFELIFQILVITAIVLGLQTVGVILMSAMLVAPASAARQWTNRLEKMMILSGLFGALSGIIGALVSTHIKNLPTGPTIVLVSFGFVLFSFLFGIKKGFIVKLFKKIKHYRDYQEKKVLCYLYALSRHHAKYDHEHSIKVLKTMGLKEVRLKKTLKILLKKEMVHEKNKNLWYITQKGIELAKCFHGSDLK